MSLILVVGIKQENIVISNGRREPMAKFPERTSVLKTLPKIVLENIFG